MQVTGLMVDEVSKAGGCVIVTAPDAVQPLSSVTTTVYVPAPRPFAVAVFCAGVEFQLKRYGEVPPEAFAVATPLDALLQLTWELMFVAAASTDAGCVIITVAVDWQPFAVVTVRL